jgi:hypothetical protein
MKKLTGFLAVAELLSFAMSSACAAGKAMSTQQQRMSDCNSQATGKKGEERKAFMSTCLKNQPAPTQQEKMKTCNADAGVKGLKGDERKTFMSRCLSSTDGH